MRALLHTFGTDGDLEPFFALGTAMKRRGHDVLMVINPAYAKRCEQLGLDMELTGTRWHIDDVEPDPRLDNPVSAANVVWNEIYVPTFTSAFRTIRAAIERDRPDVIVCHVFCLGGLWAAQEAGIPTVVVNMSPCWWYSSRDPSIYTPVVPPRWVSRWMMWSARALVALAFRAGLRRACDEIDLPLRGHTFFAGLRRAQLNIGLWSPSFRPVAPDDPPGAAVTGFVETADHGQVPEAVEAFLNRGEPPIVVGLGTSMRNRGGSIYRALARTGEALGRRVLLIGTEEAPAADVEVLAIRAAPYGLVFSRAAAVVHHGGMGTCYEALRAGRPMVVIPFVGDQFDNAQRLQELGVARVLSRRTLESASGVPHPKGPSRLTAALSAVLDDPAVVERAAALGRAVSAEPGGALVACERIERMLQTSVAPREHSA